MSAIHGIGKAQLLIIVATYLAFTFWFILLHFLYPEGESPYFSYFTDSYGVIAGIGGVIGFLISLKWEGFKSKVGRSIMAFSVGLFMQFMGQLSYGYYRYVSGVELPYPSFGDIFYFMSIPLYIYGSWLIAEISGVKVKFRQPVYKLLSACLVAIFLAIAYFVILFQHDFSDMNPIILLLEVVYPIGQAAFLSLSLIALILSKNILGGVMKPVVNLLLVALIFQYVADIYFTYQLINETLTLGGSSDYIYIIAYSLMGLSLYKFGEVLGRIKK